MYKGRSLGSMQIGIRLTSSMQRHGGKLTLVKLCFILATRLVYTDIFLYNLYSHVFVFAVFKFNNMTLQVGNNICFKYGHVVLSRIFQLCRADR